MGMGVSRRFLIAQFTSTSCMLLPPAMGAMAGILATGAVAAIACAEDCLIRGCQAVFAEAGTPPALQARQRLLAACTLCWRTGQEGHAKERVPASRGARRRPHRKTDRLLAADAADS